MAHGTSQLVNPLRSLPSLVESLKREPAKLLTNLTKCEQGQAVIRAGTQLIGDIFTSCANSIPPERKSESAPGLVVSSPVTFMGSELPSPCKGATSVGIVGLTSLAVIAGSVALLGTVSIVALNQRGD
jgi:hypothetical protein